jgi:uncharacterized membrane protein
MRNDKLKLMLRYAIMIALTAASTMLINIPAPGANGYFNLGDSMVFIAAILLGAKGGFIAGGIGSALADILLGYTIWAPFTLIIKGLEGYLAGYLLETGFGKKHPILALVPSAIWMISGYYIVKVFLYGWGPALLEVPICTVQTGVGIITARAFSAALFKTKLFKNPAEAQ